jgi:hypothetical protein
VKPLYIGQGSHSGLGLFERVGQEVLVAARNETIADLTFRRAVEQQMVVLFLQPPDFKYASPTGVAAVPTTMTLARFPTRLGEGNFEQFKPALLRVTWSGFATAMRTELAYEALGHDQGQRGGDVPIFQPIVA